MTRTFLASIFLSALYTLFNFFYYTTLYQDTTIIFRAVILSFFYILPLIFFTLSNRFLFFFLWLFLLPISSLLIYYTFAFKVTHSKELFSLMFETNLHEITSLLGITSIAFFFSSICFFIFLLVILKRTHCFIIWTKRNASIFFVSFFLLASFAFLAKTIFYTSALKGLHPMPYGFLSHFYHACKQQLRLAEFIANRKQYEGSLIVKEHETPLYVVLVIGESLRSSQLPFYGYARNTMPLVSKEQI